MWKWCCTVHFHLHELIHAYVDMSEWYWHFTQNIIVTAEKTPSMLKYLFILLYHTILQLFINKIFKKFFRSWWAWPETCRSNKFECFIYLDSYRGNTTTIHIKYVYDSNKNSFLFQRHHLYCRRCHNNRWIQLFWSKHIMPAVKMFSRKERMFGGR